MAESCDKAFGRYLRTLRERRRLTLDDVSSLSHTFPESISKGYLSRCENGHQKPAFSKVIALSRIYEVPADVLVERMELDLELERVGGPDTSTLEFTRLVDSGKEALDSGFRWDAYGYLRDAVRLAGTAPLRPAFISSEEQIATAYQHVGTVARALGRIQFALHEFQYVESSQALTPKHHALALERLACCYRSLGDLAKAENHIQRAIHEAESCEAVDVLGFIYSARARLALSFDSPEIATAFYQKAHQAHRSTGQTIECATALNNLSQCYFEQGRLAAARRTAEASLKVSSSQGQHRIRALSHLMLGELAEVTDRWKSAAVHWKTAREIAKQLKDRELRFKADYGLLKKALNDDDPASARSIRRRLTKLAPWIPQETEELVDFKALSDRIDRLR